MAGRNQEGAHALDYRQQYAGTSQPNPGGAPHPAAPYPPGFPPNPYHRPGLFQNNPLTTGQWLMIGAGAIAVGGLAWWGYNAYQKHKAQQAQQPAQAGNPNVRHINAGPTHTVPQAA